MKMEVLDRGYHTIDIAMQGGVRQFKIPVELTVAEVERLLESQAKIEKLQDERVISGGNAQLRLYWSYIYAQLEVIFRHFHPEIDVDYLKLNLLPSDAIRILAFFSENRFIDKPTDVNDSKKKLQ